MFILLHFLKHGFKPSRSLHHCHFNSVATYAVTKSAGIDWFSTQSIVGPWSRAQINSTVWFILLFNSVLNRARAVGSYFIKLQKHQNNFLHVDFILASVVIFTLCTLWNLSFLTLPSQAPSSSNQNYNCRKNLVDVDVD